MRLSDDFPCASRSAGGLSPLNAGSAYSIMQRLARLITSREPIHSQDRDCCADHARGDADEFVVDVHVGLSFLADAQKGLGTNVWKPSSIDYRHCSIIR